MRTLTNIIPNAYSAAAPPSVTIGATSATVLAAPSAGVVRTRLRIQNTHATNVLYLREDGGTVTAAAAGHHLKLGPGSAYDWDPAFGIPQGLITGLSDNAGTIVAVLYAEV